nr:hypothetical protein [Gammaproteobacteria bacterium]
MKRKVIIIISIITIALGLGGFGLYILMSGDSGKVVIAESEAKYSTRLLETPTTNNPMDFSAEDNIAYTLYKLKNTNAFRIVTTGEAKASVATQLIANEKIIIGNEAITSTVSSGLVKTATQKYFMNEEEKVFLRSSSSIDGVVATWETGTPICETVKDYMLDYGFTPFEPSAYIICPETILESSISDNGDGTYTIHLSLNPDGDYAPFYYRREVATNGSSAIIPEFEFVNLDYVIDSSWTILSVHANEKYLVKSMGIKTTCVTDCYDTYSYENIAFNEAEYNFFKQYQDMEPQGRSTEKNDDILTMLTSSLVNADGTDKTLALEIIENSNRISGL